MAKKSAIPGNRIILVDALRGFALFGIILAHISHSYAAGPLPTDVHTLGGKPANEMGSMIGIYKISEFVNAAFVNGKFYSLFTFIFGFSFFLQTKSFTRDSRNINLQFFRRALCLLLIGFIHQLFWMGDILMVYGLLMLPLVFLRQLSDRRLLIIGLLFVFNIPGMLYEVGQLFSNAIVTNSDDKEAWAFYHIISVGSLGEIFAYNLQHLPGKIHFQALSGRLFVTLGFFLLGMLAARRCWLNRVLEVKNKIYFIFLPAYALMIIFQLITMKLNYSDYTSSTFEIVLGSAINSLQCLCSIILYISFVAILFFTQHIHKLFNALANLGRTALTSYLMQTAFGLFIFYRIGLGMFGHTTPTYNVLIGLAFFGLQMALANIWLRYFNYGIAEWLLRGVTFWEFQKLRK